MWGILHLLLRLVSMGDRWSIARAVAGGGLFCYCRR